MERDQGASDTWDAFRDKFRAFEEMLLSRITVTGKREVPKAPELELVAMRRWIIHAAEHGDRTYLNYVDEPLWTETVWYDGSTHRSEDYESHYRREAEDEATNTSKLALL
jgi:hypothetical protein